MSELVSVANRVQVPSATPDDYTVTEQIIGTIAFDGFDNEGHEGELTYTAPNGFSWRGITDTNPALAKPSAAFPKDGVYSLLFDFEGGADGTDSRRQIEANIATAYSGYSDIKFSFDMYIPSNYYHRHQKDIGFDTDNNKFFVIWGGGRNAYNVSAERTGPFLDFEFNISGDGESKAKVYIGASADGTSFGFRTVPLPFALLISAADRIGAGTAANPQGGWVNYSFRIKYESRASFIANGGTSVVPHTTGDGIIQLWKTPAHTGVIETVWDERDLPLYATTRVEPYVDDDGFDQIIILGAANSGFDEDTNIYIDNVNFSENDLR